MTKRVFLVIGTRPEAIKMAPVIAACRKHDSVEPIVCFTGQHREMLQQVANYFGIVAEIDLELMKPNQSLATLTSRCISELDEVLGETARRELAA